MGPLLQSAPLRGPFAQVAAQFFWSLKSLKRHYFERHQVVPSEAKLQLSDDVFGLNAAQFRRLRGDLDEGMTQQCLYGRRRREAARVAFMGLADSAR